MTTTRRILAAVTAISILAGCDPDIRIGTPATSTPTHQETRK